MLMIRLLLILGVALCTLFPAARAYNHWIGWLWYWLIATPAIALCVLQRERWWRRLRHSSRQWQSSRVRRVSAPLQARRMLARPLARTA